MASTKLLGKKREQLIAPEFENNSKEESTTTSIPGYLWNCTYTNYSPNDNNEKDIEEGLLAEEPSKPQLKLSEDTFKIKKSFNLDFKKIEKVIPFKNKSTNFNEILKNEKEYLYHFLHMKNYTINELKEINLLKKIPDKKFHMILDIDSTMVKALEKNEIPNDRKPYDFEISGSIDNRNTFEFYCRYRPYLFHFINELKDYFNFYISTLGHINYANKIIEDLIKKAGISIPQNNIVSNKNPGQKLAKSLKEIIPIANIKEELNETVILDDIVNYWIKPPIMDKTEEEIKQCIKCLIPCKRYVINTAKGPDTEKFGILIHNNILEDKYNNSFSYSISVDYNYCIEKDSDSENGKRGQFYYLEIFLKNCVKFCLYTGKPMVETMDFFRKKIFENCKFNIKHIGDEWNYTINKIINELGGEIVVKTDETTHFIVNDVIKKDIIKTLKKNQYVVDINYIFQCYFNLYRMKELENQAIFKEKK